MDTNEKDDLLNRLSYLNLWLGRYVSLAVQLVVLSSTGPIDVQQSYTERKLLKYHTDPEIYNTDPEIQNTDTEIQDINPEIYNTEETIFFTAPYQNGQMQIVFFRTRSWYLNTVDSNI